MPVLLPTYGSRGEVVPMMGLAVSSWAFGAEVRVCGPPDFVAAGACDALLATGVLPSGARL